jgi:hypothetical protein
MRIENILFKYQCFRLIYLTATAGLIVLCCSSPIWGAFPGNDRLPIPVMFSDDSEDPLKAYLCKRGSSNQNFQQWQDLSPKEREKLRKKYREWQSLPPAEQQTIRRRLDQLNRMPSQQRKIYKQLFRQWQHLPPDERRQLQKDLENWENLSPRQQKAIRRRFRK